MSSLPAEPGTREWEDVVDFMRRDLDSGMGYTKLIETTRKRMEEEGRDFDKEFAEWKKKNL